MASRKKIAFFSLGGLLIVIIIVLLFLPTMIKNYAVKNSKELVGRQIAIDNLSINYFTSTLSVIGFKMFEANEKDVFTSFDTLVINTVPYKFISNVKALDQLYLDGLTLNISKKDSTYNYDDIIAYYKAKDTIPADTTNTETFKYLLENIELKNASFNFYDGDVDQATVIKDFSFFIPVIAWDQEHQSDADITCNFENGGVLKAQSNVHPGSGEFTSTITLENLNLEAFYKYAAQYAEISDLGGIMNTTINLNGNINTPEETLVSGNVEVLNFLMKDNKNQKVLASEKINTKLKEINLSKSSYVFESLVIDKPYMKVELDSVSNNMFRIFKLDEEGAAEGETESELSMYYALNSFKIDDGIMDYTDNLTGQPFNYHLSDIQLNSENIESTSERIDLYSTMLLNERGTLNAEIGYNPADPVNNITLDIAVKDFILTDLNIYSNYYTGHSVLNGDMYYFSDSKVVNGQLDSQNNLLIKNVSVENNKGGLFSIPLKFAVFLLKDKNGDIELDVPVGGNLDDPQVDTWDLVWTTLKKKIFNATKNPVKPLARFMNVKPEDLESMAIQYPDTIPNDKQKAQLDLLLDLEQKKQGLKIEMNYVADEEAKKQIAASILGHEIINDSISNNIKIDTDLAQRTVLKDSITTTPDTNNILLADSQAFDSIANTYIKAYVRNIDNYLKTKNPSTAIVVQKAKISDPDNMAAEPGFKMKYTLKEEDDTSTTETSSTETN